MPPFRKKCLKTQKNLAPYKEHIRDSSKSNSKGNCLGMGISNSNDSFDEESSAIAMIENSKEKRMYIIKGTPCIICNAKYGEQCKNELADEKCRSRFVRLEV